MMKPLEEVLGNKRYQPVIKEYDKVAQNILSSIEENPAGHQRVLYHYTSFNAFQAMMESKQLWLTHFQHLNDPSELIYTRQMMIWAVEFWVNNGHADGVFDWSHFLGNFVDFSLRNSVYIFSLCEAKNYLPAWRAYGDNGAGIAIGFKFTGNFPDAPDIKLQFDKVRYEQKEYLVPITTLLRWAQEFFQALLTAAGSELSIQDRLDLRRLASTRLASFFIPIMPIIKHSAYVEEKEYRLVIHGEPLMPPIPDKYKFFRQNPRTPPLVDSIPTVKLPFDMNHIHEIWVGPRCHKEHAKQAILEWLRKHNIPLDESKIYFSDIPYRG